MLQTWLVAVLMATPQGSGSMACPSIVDDRARLACYDELFGRAAPQLTPSHAAPTPEEALPPVAAAVTVPAAPAVVSPAAPPAPVAGPADNGAAAAPDLTAEFGLTVEQSEARARQVEPAAAPTELRASIVAVEPSPSGRFVLRLDNGQTWAQVEPSNQPLFNAGETLRIRRAAFGSFLASGLSSGTSVRVRRLK